MNNKQTFFYIKARIIARRLKQGSVMMLDGRLVKVSSIPIDTRGIQCGMPCRVCEFADNCSGIFEQVCLELEPDKEHQYRLASVMQH